MKRLFTDEKEKIICELYLSGINCPQIAIENNTSTSVIWRILKRNNIPIRHISLSKTIYSFNKYYFDDIDNEEKAYWLGFISADGSVIGNEFILELHELDYNHLFLFKNYLNSTHPLKKHVVKNKFLKLKDESILYRYTIRSNYLIDSLSKYNIIPRKTYTLSMPSIREDLIRHYIRGYFDGDGGFYLSYNKYHNTNNLTFELVSNIYIITDIYNILVDECNLNKTKIELRNNNISRIRWAGRDQISRIFHYLYDNSTIYLERKKLKIQDEVT